MSVHKKEATRPGRKFGKNALKTKRGKLFAPSPQGTLVVKLPKEQVDALVAAGVGKPFDPDHGRHYEEVAHHDEPRGVLGRAGEAGVRVRGGLATNPSTRAGSRPTVGTVEPGRTLHGDPAYLGRN